MEPKPEEMEGEGKKRKLASDDDAGEHRPLVPSEMDVDKGKEASASVTAAAAAAAGRRKAHQWRSSDVNLKAYAEMRAQVKGNSARSGRRFVRYQNFLVGGKVVIKPMPTVPPHLIPAVPQYPRPGVVFPDGTYDPTYGQNPPRVPSDMDVDRGKEAPASATTSSGRRKALQWRSSDDNMKAYREMRAQVKGESNRNGRRLVRYQTFFVGGRLIAKPEPKVPPHLIPAVPQYPRPGVVFPNGAYDPAYGQNPPRVPSAPGSEV